MPGDFLFTVDVDWVPGSEAGLVAILELLEHLGVPSTLFVTGKFADANSGLVEAAHDQGHEVGVHGWAHGMDHSENFSSGSEEIQRLWLSKATTAVGDTIGESPVSFRAPNLSIGPHLLPILEELGYKFDSSVPARRYDGIFGTVKNHRYFLAPPNPYFPALRRPWRRGSSQILELPPSALLLPVIMTSIRKVGLRPTVLAAKLVARRRAPVNFYCHPWEFVAPGERADPSTRGFDYRSKTGPEWLEPLRDFLRFVLEEGFRFRTLGATGESWLTDR